MDPQFHRDTVEWWETVIATILAKYCTDYKKDKVYGIFCYMCITTVYLLGRFIEYKNIIF